MTNEQLADRIVALMNEALAADPDAVEQLVRYRVHCSETLADHPAIQCGAAQGYSTVGLLGILNGIVGTMNDGSGFVAAEMTDEGAIVRFVRR